jgi:uncharacterized membrane protein YuzA (DUF378 family)
MAEMKIIDWIAITLLIVGGLNWGLTAWFNLNLVSMIGIDWAEKTVYTLVALAAIYSPIRLFFIRE